MQRSPDDTLGEMVSRRKMLMTSRIKRTFAFLRYVASTVAVMVFGVLVLATATRASEEWLTDYDEAIAESARTGRPVMTLFTGSDWCPHCRTLEERVFATPEFQAWSEEHVCLLYTSPSPRDRSLSRMPSSA